MVRFAKYAACGFVVILAVGAGLFVKFWWGIGSSEDFPAPQAREFASNAFYRYGFELTAADLVEHAWQDHHWMDAGQRYMLRLSPERLAALRAALLAQDGKVWSGWQTSVSTGPLSFQSEQKLPSWWKTEALKGPEEFRLENKHEDGGGVNGMNLILSADGVVLIQVWKT